MNGPPRFLQISDRREAVECLKKVGVDPYGIEAMAPKMRHVNVCLEGIRPRTANIIKQEMLSLGGDAAVSRGTIDCSVDVTDVILMGTEKQLDRFAEKVVRQPFGLRKISEEIRELLGHLGRSAFVLETPRRKIDLGERVRVMGIINCTPDSFSDGSRYARLEDAVAHGIALEQEGADVLDVGGESTRPGSSPVGRREEMRRVIPLIKELARRVSVPISVDTRKAEVARAAIEAGAEIVNDVSAMRHDRDMIGVVAKSGVPVVLMHMRGTPRNMQKGDLTYASITGEIIRFLRGRMEKALEGGVRREKMLVDPGIGFGKTAEDNARIIGHLRELKTLGRPIVLGPSRKAFIGKIAGGVHAMNRLEGTAAAVACAVLNGARVVRVHDVKFMRRVTAMAEAISRG